MNPVAIEAHLTLVLIQWMIIIAAAWAFGRLGKFFGQPLAVGEIAAGILLGPSALGAIWPHDWPVLFPPSTQQSLQLLGKLGLIFLLFQVGMEFDYSHLRSRSKTVTAVSALGMIMTVFVRPGHRARGCTAFAPETPFVWLSTFFLRRAFHFRAADHGPDSAGNETGTHRHRRDGDQHGGD
jgi:hypothetical protein